MAIVVVVENFVVVTIVVVVENHVVLVVVIVVVVVENLVVLVVVLVRIVGQLVVATDQTIVFVDEAQDCGLIVVLEKSVFEEK